VTVTTIFVRSFISIGLAAVAIGCGKGNPHLTGAEVSGVVRCKGQPLTGGTIRLIDPNDPNRSMSGHILGDGTYKVVNAPVGELVAVIETETAKSDPRAFLEMAKSKGAPGDVAKPQDGPPLKYVPIHKKYNTVGKSPLKVTVEKGSQVRDFEVD
jgi:hypothetical protein